MLAVLSLSLLMLSLGWLVARHGGVANGGNSLLCECRPFEREELDSLRAEAGAGKNAVNFERAVQRQLLLRVKGLESENAVLKEDILVFERLLLAADEPGALKIENLRIVADRPGRCRYSMLLIFRPDKQHPEFQGRMQLLLGYVRDGKREQLSLLEKTEEADLRFKNLTRRSGVFDVPANATQLGLEVRLLQGDTLKVKQIVQP